MRGTISVVGVALLALLVAPVAHAKGPKGKGPGKKIAVQTRGDAYRALERALVEETNALRANPTAYVPLLKKRLQRYDGYDYTNEQGKVMTTNEGIPAVFEAMRVLKETDERSQLRRVRGLDRAAGDLVTDQRHGRTGHVGSDGSQPYERVGRHFEWDKVAVENVYYGKGNAREIVLDLLVDDGVGNRGHREALLDPRFEVTGVRCGPHKRFGTVCVMEYTVPQRDLRY